VIYPAQDV